MKQPSFVVIQVKLSKVQSNETSVFPLRNYLCPVHCTESSIKKKKNIKTKFIKKNKKQALIANVIPIPKFSIYNQRMKALLHIL